MQPVTIGSLTLSVQALITAICGIVIGLVMLFTAPQMWPASLLVTAASFLAAYNVNCAIVGKCNAWAWILTSMYLLYTVLIVLLLVFVKQFMGTAITPMLPKLGKARK